MTGVVAWLAISIVVPVGMMLVAYWACYKARERREDRRWLERWAIAVGVEPLRGESNEVLRRRLYQTLSHGVPRATARRIDFDLN